MMPTFLLIGAMKAGTTILYQALAQHPEVYMSPVKEPNFFAFAEDPPSFNAPLDRQDGGINEKTISDPEQYEALFDGAEPDQARGEASHTTLYWPQAPANVQRFAPEAQLVAILRNPVERAYSEYLHFVRDGKEPLDSFEAALDAEPERIEANWAFGRYVDRGRYHEQLLRFYDRFEASQIRVFLFDDFREDPQSVVEDFFSFIDVDPGFSPDLSRRVNKSGVPRSRIVQETFSRLQALKDRIRPVIPQPVIDYALSLRNANLEKPTLSPAVRERLVDTFRPEVERLEGLLDRDLSHWLE
jgi:hypothetical protein